MDSIRVLFGSMFILAVISVPSYFNDGQRLAMKDAGLIAGFDSVSLINETTAAALSFGLKIDLTDKDDVRKVLVLDIGASTTSASMVEIDGRMFEVKSISGDIFLGGDSFDNKMVNYFANKFQEQYKCDLRKSPQSMRKLKIACEQAKVKLSTATTATIVCDSIFEGHSFSDTITRGKFEELCDYFFKKIKNLMNEVLICSDCPLSEVTDILLFGGSSQIPRVQYEIKEMF